MALNAEYRGLVAHSSPHAVTRARPWPSEAKAPVHAKRGLAWAGFQGLLPLCFVLPRRRRRMSRSSSCSLRALRTGQPLPTSLPLAETDPWRLAVPALIASLVSLAIYPSVSLAVASLLDEVALGVIKGDVSQFMQNFFNFNTLLFSFFVSQTYASLYAQQESLYMALFSEISEARSLLEQLTLVSQNRPSYRSMLESMNAYISELILGVRLGCPPAVLVAAKPANDPLENILYATSVGVPSVVYDTVRSLRQARGVRLGATQRKFPLEHFILLNVLGALELLVFPLLGAGISGYEPDAASPGHVLWVQSVVFALLAGGVVLALQVVQDLRTPTCGLYNLNEALDEMVEGIRGELQRRLDAAPQATSSDSSIEPMKVSNCDECENKWDNEAWPSLQPRGEQDGGFLRLGKCAAVGLLAALLFVPIASLMESSFSGPALQAIREDNNAQWLQNCFTGVGLVFSLFAAQTFSFLYSQQEAIYLALYSEVSEAKALLEQLALVCKGRPTLSEALQGLQRYVREDLRRLDCNPARLLSGRVHTDAGRSDPLEQVLYFTSVGVPSYVYDTVKSLRSARGDRLGATQRKLPLLHFVVLAILSVVELLVFPVLAAGCANLDSTGSIAALPGHILFFQATLFGLMATAITLTFVVLYDLWRPIGDSYNFETILQEMVSGMEEELEVRLIQCQQQDIEAEVPSGVV
ncbi:unnamed protein product [Durusdinium trenchii]|uniref:Uncharacterized protein n=1 Tax=Durusdinium trenchii TaxID=1381693 RepID=A0ABP0P2W2_9DINO